MFGILYNIRHWNDPNYFVKSATNKDKLKALLYDAFVSLLVYVGVGLFLFALTLF